MSLLAKETHKQGLSAHASLLSHPKADSLSKTTSVLLGIASLIGWSAILNSFDFFANRYPKETFHDVTFLFPIPLKFASFIWGLAMDQISKKFSIYHRIGTSLIIQSFFMVAMPLVALASPNQFGFVIQLVLCFLIGTTTCIAQNSAIALISTLDKKCAGLYWIFTAWAGLSMNFGRAAVLLIFGDNDEGINNGTIVYFVMAAFFIYATVFTLTRFLKSPYYASTLADRAASNISEKEEKEGDISTQLPAITAEEQGPFKVRLIASIKKVKWLAFSVFINYVITFMLYPGVSIYQKDYTFVNSFAWATLIMQISYNIGDTCGKILSGFNFYNSKFLYFMVFGRIAFFFTFLMSGRSDNAFFQDDVFALLNIFLFGVTNGLVTAGLMLMGPKRASSKDEINLIAFINAFSLTFGISVGAFLAITLSKD